MNSLSKKNIELAFILLHLALGFVIYYVPFSSKLISFLVVFVSIFLILISKDKVLAVLIACAYVATSDVFFRMTGGLFFYELHKYLLIVLVIIGFLFDQVKVKGQVYLFYVALLLLLQIFSVRSHMCTRTTIQ